jgi:hypothetical protein
MTAIVQVFISTYQSAPVHFAVRTKAKEVIEALKGNATHAVLNSNLSMSGTEIVSRPDDFIIGDNIYRLELINPLPTRTVDASLVVAERRRLFASYDNKGMIIRNIYICYIRTNLSC